MISPDRSLIFICLAISSAASKFVSKAVLSTFFCLIDFPESVDYWNYWLQAVIYLKLVQEFLKDAIDNTWSMEFRFVVFDRNNQLYAFPVSTSTLKDWQTRFINVQKEAKYHYNSKDFTLPYKYAQGIVNL